MKLEKVCRYCKHLSPREGMTWGGGTTTYMCYKYEDSDSCGPDYKSLCCKFEWCNDLKEVFNNDK